MLVYYMKLSIAYALIDLTNFIRRTQEWGSHLQSLLLGG